MQTSETKEELNTKLKELEFDLSTFRDFVEDNSLLSQLHFAISTYISDSGARDND